MTLQHFHKQNMWFFQAMVINYRELFFAGFLSTVFYYYFLKAV